MKTPFFITGLPRCRSAWLANLFCTDRSVCFHEPQKSVTDLIDGGGFYRIGVASATLVLCYPALLAKYPTARWLYVDRPRADSERSLLKFTREEAPHVQLLRKDVARVFDLYAAGRARMAIKAHNPDADEERVLWVKFEDLDDAGLVCRAWEHLLPGEPFNALRYQVLKDLKIEQNLAARIKEAVL